MSDIKEEKPSSTWRSPVAHNLSSCCYARTCWPEAFKERFQRRRLTMPPSSAARICYRHRRPLQIVAKTIVPGFKQQSVRGPGEGVFTPEALLAHEQQLLVLGVLLDAGIKLRVGFGEGVAVQQADVVVVEELQNKRTCKDMEALGWGHLSNMGKLMTNLTHDSDRVCLS
jgi:hypothetical protein